MVRTASPKGTCAYCAKEITRQGAVRHLEACAERRAAGEAADRRVGRAENLYHLRDAWSGQYWLDLEIRGAAPLAVLDSYLRAMWLERCGHLSSFSIGSRGGREIDMNRKVYAAFEEATELTHIYDFGTETVTLVKAVGTRRWRTNLNSGRSPKMAARWFAKSRRRRSTRGASSASAIARGSTVTPVMRLAMLSVAPGARAGAVEQRRWRPIPRSMSPAARQNNQAAATIVCIVVVAGIRSIIWSSQRPRHAAASATSQIRIARVRRGCLGLPESLYA